MTDLPPDTFDGPGIDAADGLDDDLRVDDVGAPDELYQQARGSARASLSADVEPLPTITVPVDSRPGYSVTYDPNFPLTKLNTFRRKAKSKAWDEGVDPVKFAAVLLANQVVSINHDGSPIRDRDGRPWTFATREFLDEIGNRGLPAVRKFYGRDSVLDRHANELLIAAGHEDADDVDPTS